MSDLSIYELEDIIWDDFERSGDHIVPHAADNHGSEDKCEGDSCKKPRLEMAPHQSNEGNLYASGSVCQPKDERDSKTLNKETNMIEKDSWSHIPDGVFAASGDADSAKDMPSVQSGDAKNTSGAVDRISYNDLNLFSNDGDDKESSDLLYYGWPDIGNFEDVDRMLSNCDSSFGLGVTGNDDELVWFTSEDPGGGYEEAMKMDLKFPSSESTAITNVSQDHESRESDNKTSGFVSERKNEFKLKDQKEQSTQHDSVDYMQSSGYLHPGHDHDPMQLTGGKMMTGMKSEIKGSSQVHSMESSSRPGIRNQSGMILQASGNDLVPPQKQFHMFENKIESQSDMEGVKKGASAELDSLDVPEGSSISSELDEISLEATTFRQLQQVMLQLDLRTKLCIRDSLYRLARSAEQRHNYAGIGDRISTGGPSVTEGNSKYTGLMDMETDTNPIDRTIAHLLFHRPSESSNMPAPLPLKPIVKVHGSTTGPPMVAEKPSCQQAENKSDDKISSTRKN